MGLTPQLLESNARILAGLRAGDYDFLDLGTSGGGGFKIGEQLGGKRGAGLDLNPRTVQKNLDEGRDVLCMDVRSLPPDIKGVRFAVCNHILEHLPNIYDVGSVVAALASVCSDYLRISGPYFDTEEFLYKRNLKVLHSAMLTHLCKFRTIDFIHVLFDLGLRDFSIGLTNKMRDSGHRCVHRADAPGQGLWYWEEGKSLPKPFVVFDPPLYRDMLCVVKLNAAVDMAEVFRPEKVLFRSSLNFSE